MISYIKGAIKSFNERSVLVVAGTIGYRVAVPIFVLEGMKEGKEVELYCHTKLDTRNDTIELYGFPTAEELRFFELLLSISGVGPRSAMGALSVAKLEDLKRTIAHGDPQLLQKVAGIGKKIAERIVVELKDKMGELVGGRLIGSAPGDGDVVEALRGLGYREREVVELLKELPKDLEGSEARVKEVLKRLGKRR
ncbi:Holliday junction DNA helicase RuvA [Candidatus Uhrbacteria bacterium RIFCSPHIGHO2_12_FULL_54_23]|uniref:Holliday junction branch migration complex subunit RuvA n=3 Tax=Candidatus Uhriibacteriota TaxID=1752732 RepID=A0A1F7UMD0_9BACT|nr:MAG: Holliday junction DNA helicase RuvA [Candidatus Uhrbacteria bacterium RIFCSPHIGHO2_12_FULL_54_23]OGL85556.1 MAG: Holliday junction DNA helicase RuvA [Candidatus Uhrbacteria bacterium RIFCSPLOWO2_01_FULL_55_36]OGL90810.1 MAG: Holliday junction DNA helicase RuvA [Candidatus Uhrbacteria bacterium RIFCSPLOWO2_02_FULL_54_37]